MRIALLLLPLSLVAGPAPAQPVPQLPPQLTDPATVDRVTDAMQSLSDALLDVRVGNVQAALQGRRPTRAERNMTVRDLGRREDPNFDRNLHQQIAAAKPKIEQSISAVNTALPQVTADLQRAQRAIERAIANLPDPNYPNR